MITQKEPTHILKAVKTYLQQVFTWIYVCVCMCVCVRVRVTLLWFTEVEAFQNYIDKHIIFNEYDYKSPTLNP